MNTTDQQLERHYGRGHIFESIMSALREAGKDIAKLTPADLALVDEFHTRGREATIELARRAPLTPGLKILDVGCGSEARPATWRANTAAESQEST
jgi:MPBQ/MSBQ methyltransferase